MSNESSNGRRLPTISKTRFVAADQCEKRLYLETHHPDLADAPDAHTRSIMEEGLEVGELARERYTGGLYIDEDPLQIAAALEATAEAMDRDDVHAIYEAAFKHDDLPVRVDVLRRDGDGGWEIVEVKSSGSTKEHHVLDAAFQYYVLQQEGIEVSAVTLLHPDREYTVGEKGLDLDAFFTEEDVTDDALALQGEIAADRLPRYRETLEQDEAPDIEVGDHCKKPHRCPFYGHCHRALDELDHTIDELPHLRGTRREVIRSTFGHDLLRVPTDRAARVARARAKGWTEEKASFLKGDAPDLFTDNQRRVFESIKSGEPYWDEDGIREALEGVVFPAHFMDFETVNPVIPVWPNTSPNQIIPFQWSNHTLGEGGRLYHQEFISMEKADPRPRFLHSLLKAIGYNLDEDLSSWEEEKENRGSIFVYSSYEKRILDEMAELYPEYTSVISDVKARLVDLLPVVRNNIYHPDFGGSYSIKSVLPALVEGSGYDDLEIRDGANASAAFLELVSPQTSLRRRMEISEGLLKYCERDTEHLYKLLMVIAPDIVQRLEDPGDYTFGPARRRGAARSRRR